MTPHYLPLLPLCLASASPSLRTALVQEGIAFCDHSPHAAAGRFLLHDSRTAPAPRAAAGQVLLDVGRLADDLEFDPWAALADEYAATHRWKIGRLSLREEIARVDKRHIRRLAMVRLRRRLEELGGVWFRLSGYPFPYQSAFNLRIDHDEYVADDFDSLMSAIDGREGACSHYICAVGFEHAADALRRLRGQHVGSHGYHHHVYQGREENLRNIGRGIDSLLRHGLDPDGFVAPHGRFHRDLLVALESLEVSHSSEFGLVYDELPMFPPDSGVLQVPVHPICLGLFLEAARIEGVAAADAARTAADYFSRLVTDRYQRGEPVFLYGHPSGRLGRYPDVLRAVFAAVDECGALWNTSLSRFADWWRKRQQANVRVMQHFGGDISVHVDTPAVNYRLAGEYWRGEHVAVIPLDDPVVRFAPGDLAYQTRRAGGHIQPVRVDGPHGLFHDLRQWLDWERVTPLEDIRADSLRGWMKRTLRRIKP